MKRSPLNQLALSLAGAAMLLTAPAFASDSGLPGTADRPSNGAVDFRVVAGNAVPYDDFAAKVTVIGCSWGTVNGDRGAMTAQVHIGSQTIDPFGPATDKAAGNVNNGSLEPQHIIINAKFDEDTPVSVTGRGWEYHESLGTTPYVRNSHEQTDSVMVLRHGDAVPAFTTIGGQETVENYLKPYTNHAGTHLLLHPNQAIYLFEFNDLSGSFGVDYQDLVVLITFADSVEELQNNPYPPIGNLGTSFD